MEIKQSYLAMIKKFPGGWDAMAAALGMSRDALENRVYERKGQGVLSQTAMQLQEFSFSKLYAEAVATASGGTFVMLPPIAALTCNESLFKKFTELHGKLGEFSVLLNDALDDGKIDKREKMDLASITAEIHKALAEMQALTFRLYCRDDASESDGERAL